MNKKRRKKRRKMLVICTDGTVETIEGGRAIHAALSVTAWSHCMLDTHGTRKRGLWVLFPYRPSTHASRETRQRIIQWAR